MILGEPFQFGVSPHAVVEVDCLVRGKAIETKCHFVDGVLPHPPDFGLVDRRRWTSDLPNGIGAILIRVSFPRIDVPR